MPEDVPDFSPLAASYARGRPRYPAELFAWLASLTEGHDLAWDCATGSGQAAIGLAAHFKRVIATDASAEQLRHADPHPGIVYRAAPAEQSGLEAGSLDLVTVAAAIHWFDLAAFAAEVRRVTRLGAVLAVWTYHVGRVAPPFDEVFHRFYWNRMKPWFARGADQVDDGYRSLDLPGAPIEAPPFEIRAAWTLPQMLDYVRSWSAVRAYRETRGDDPVAGLADELAPIFGDLERSLPVRLPLHLRVQRL